MCVRLVLYTDDLNSMGLRLRVYGGDRLRRDRLIGERFIAFSSLDLDELEEQSQGHRQSLEKLIELEPRSNIEVRFQVLVTVFCFKLLTCKRQFSSNSWR